MMAYVGCLCYTLIYAMRTNMSIAIVCMVKSVNTTGENRTQVGMCGAIDSDGSVVSQIRLIIS